MPWDEKAPQPKRPERSRERCYPVRSSRGRLRRRSSWPAPGARRTDGVGRIDEMTRKMFRLMAAARGLIRGRGRRISSAGEQVTPAGGWLRGIVEPLRGKVERLRGKVERLRGKVERLRGKVEPFRGIVEPFRGKVGPFRGIVGPNHGIV